MANFELASYSKDRTNELRQRLGLNYAHRSAGTLNVYRKGESVDGIREQAELLAPFGVRCEELDTAGVIAVEPALKHGQEFIKGAFYFPDDDSGDAHLFCRELHREIVSAGGTVETATRVFHVAIDHGQVYGAETANGLVKADAVVIAAGNGSPELVRPLGMSLPIKPVKGYSLTLDVDDGDQLPRTPLVDETLHAAITPMDSRLRLTSTVDFVGFDKRIDPACIDNLFSLLKQLYPRIASRIDRENARPWAGLRPVSSDGRPFIGPGNIPGLYINAGHGPLGWTLAMGSAQLLTDLIDGRPADIDGTPFNATR